MNLIRFIYLSISTLTFTEIKRMNLAMINYFHIHTESELRQNEIHDNLFYPTLFGDDVFFRVSASTRFPEASRPSLSASREGTRLQRFRLPLDSNSSIGLEC